MFVVYIIKSEKNDKYYTGFTTDLQKRLKYHNTRKNKSTKQGIPWKLVRQECFDNKRGAWLRERQIKSYKGGEAFKKLIKLNQGEVAERLKAAGC